MNQLVWEFILLTKEQSSNKLTVNNSCWIFVYSLRYLWPNPYFPPPPQKKFPWLATKIPLCEENLSAPMDWRDTCLPELPWANHATFIHFTWRTVNIRTKSRSSLEGWPTWLGHLSLIVNYNHGQKCTDSCTTQMFFNTRKMVSAHLTNTARPYTPSPHPMESVKTVNFDLSTLYWPGGEGVRDMDL